MPNAISDVISFAPLSSSSAYIFTSESVSEGHPDKVSNYIADSLLDAYIVQDARSRVACEALCKESAVVVGREITSGGSVDHVAVVREAIRDIGYADPGFAFNAEKVQTCKSSRSNLLISHREWTRTRMPRESRVLAIKALCLGTQLWKRRS